MNVFNRIVTIIVCSVLMLFIGYVAVAPITSVHQAQVWLVGVEEWLLAWQAENPTNFLVAQAATLTAAVLLLGTLIGMEVLSGRPRGVRVRTAEGGLVELDTDSIVRRLAWQLDQLAEVVSVVPYVRSRVARLTFGWRSRPHPMSMCR